MPSSLEFANLGQAVGRPDYRRNALLVTGRHRQQRQSNNNVAQCCDVSEFDVVDLCKSLCDT
jgi:hypothetical protein